MMLRAIPRHGGLLSRDATPCPLHAKGRPATRRPTTCHAAPDDRSVTHGQKLRGHGAHGGEGWKEAGWDLKHLQPELREMLVHYGQLAQVTYDRLGLDIGETTWGHNTEPASKLLDYLTQDYPLDPSARVIPGHTPKGTRDIYHIPKGGDLSPLIYACPGKGSSTAADASDEQNWWERVIDGVLATTAGVPINLIGGSRPLFSPNPATGRGSVARSTFMGYVAVSQPTGSEKEVDVAFVWRGTIYKEEWAENFAEDKLVKWDPPKDTEAAMGPPKDVKAAYPWDIGVHEGFQDLYLRPAEQPDPLAPEAVPAQPGNTELAPRQVVHKWMKELMRKHNVTTITTTGHSLGGALSTLSAFDIAEELERLWADSNQVERRGWTTKAKPTVTAIGFAPPRVGNFKFLRTFSDELKAKKLRICNVGDIVPKTPGLWGQLVTSVLDRVGIKVYVDMDSLPARVYGYVSDITGLLLGTWLFGSHWSYMHAGMILEVDSEKELGDEFGGKKDGKGEKKKIGLGQRHNLEMYLYLLSKKGTTGTDRNPLFVNKSDDILTDEDIPANWWCDPKTRRFKLNQQGRWTRDKEPQDRWTHAGRTAVAAEARVR